MDLQFKVKFTGECRIYDKRQNSWKNVRVANMNSNNADPDPTLAQKIANLKIKPNIRYLHKQFRKITSLHEVHALMLTFTLTFRWQPTTYGWNRIRQINSVLNPQHWFIDSIPGRHNKLTLTIFSTNLWLYPNPAN